MPIKKLVKENFIYLAFRRGNASDLNDFRKELDKLVQSAERDIVVDLTKETAITEREIAMLAIAVKKLHGTPHRLRIIAAPVIYKRFENHNLGKADNVALYENHDALLAELNRSETDADTTDGNM